MILRSLVAENFRNLAPEPVLFHPRANIVVGRNGQGKTNLLEAISFLATTRSFRTTRSANLARFDAPNIFVSGAVEREGLVVTQSVGLEMGEHRRRVLMRNGETVSLPAYVGMLTLFAYSQARLAILRGGPDERRRFLDRGIVTVDPGHVDRLTRYARLLRQRNALLQAVSEHRESTATLEAWNAEFASTAAALTHARGAYCADLAIAFAEIAQRHRHPAGGIEIRYSGSGDEDELRSSLARLRSAELRARTTLVGPQRDDVAFLVAGRPAAEVLSGGEAKMAVLFLKFAKMELFRRRSEDAPLFLLDDVDAELDLGVLQNLLTGLPAETQLFATSAKESFLDLLRVAPHRRLTVENGSVTGATEIG